MKVIITTLIMNKVNIKDVIYNIYIAYNTAVRNIRQWSKDWSSYLERWRL